MRSRFDQELNKMNDDLIEIGSHLESALNKMIHVLHTFDEKNLAEIQAHKNEVEQLEREIQSRALKLLCFQQPVAKDLRAISAALNMVTDMERIADQTEDIAEIMVLFKDREFIKEPQHIVQMIEKCIIMVSKSIDAFVAKDIHLAKNVISRDDEVDELFLFIRDELIDLINRDKQNGEQAIDFIMIAKYLERIADHAVSISEWVIFNVTGEHKENQIL